MSDMTYSELLAMVMKIRELRRTPVAKPRSTAVINKLDDARSTKKAISGLSAEDIQSLLFALGGAQ